MFFCSYVFKKNTCSSVLMSSKKYMFFCSFTSFSSKFALETFLCATYMRAKDSLKHVLERQMHRYLHLRE